MHTKRRPYSNCVQRGSLDNEQVARRLDMSSSAGPKHGSAPSVRPSHLQQLFPADSFFMSATPLPEQQERALRQVLQEEVMRRRFSSGQYAKAPAQRFIM